MNTKQKTAVGVLMAIGATSFGQQWVYKPDENVWDDSDISYVEYKELKVLCSGDEVRLATSKDVDEVSYPLRYRFDEDPADTLNWERLSDRELVLSERIGWFIHSIGRHSKHEKLKLEHVAVKDPIDLDLSTFDAAWRECEERTLPESVEDNNFALPGWLQNRSFTYERIWDIKFGEKGVDINGNRYNIHTKTKVTESNEYKWVLVHFDGGKHEEYAFINDNGIIQMLWSTHRISDGWSKNGDWRILNED